MENIEIDLRGYLNNDRFGMLSKQQIQKTIRIKLDNFTLVIYGHINGVQLPSVERSVNTIRSAFDSGRHFNLYDETISNFELSFSVEHYCIEDTEGHQTNNVDPESLRMINQILQSIS